MTDEELNFYDHLEWLKTIYLLRLQEITESEKKVAKLEEKCKDLDSSVTDYIKLTNSLRNSLSQKDVELCEFKTKNEVLEKELNLIKSDNNIFIEAAEKYHKIPKIIRRFFASE